MALHGWPVMRADEAAAFIRHGDTVGLGGFTAAGTPKVVPRALAALAQAEHAAGRPFRIRLLTGASTGPDVDDALAEADAIAYRAPYMASRPLRAAINAGRVEYADLHLSHVTPMLLAGLLGRIDVAVLEVSDLTPDGRARLTSGVGNAPAFARLADRVIVEVNRWHSPRVGALHDLLVLPPPPHRGLIPVHRVLDRIGTSWLQLEPRRIVAVVEHEQPDGIAPLRDLAVAGTIAGHLVRFLLDELAAGRIPERFLPVQCGVGAVANAVLAALGAEPAIPPFEMWTEVFQDAAFDLLRAGRLTAASACALAIADDRLRAFVDAIDAVGERVVLRPIEVANHPALARQLGLIALNTAVEVDIYGHVNSTHVRGTQLLNGIGGSGDFERNAYLAVFCCPSTRQGGAVSTIVPFATHVDHSEHSTQVVVTEQGLADLRGLAPMARAERLIECCAHPDWRPALRDYVRAAGPGHLRHDLGRAFAELVRRGVSPASAPT